jgi:hypothetical protein
MKTIWKYPLAVMDEQIISMPQGAFLLSVQVQRNRGGNNVCLWALVDDSAPEEGRRIRMVGTGHDASAAVRNIGINRPPRFIDTFQLQDGDLVFHVFG